MNYGFKDDNPTGYPFMIIEYIDGASLFTVDFDSFDGKQRTHLYGQLADIFIQLHLQHQPLTININDQEIDGLDVTRIIKPDQTYSLTIDYTYTLIQLVFNQFLRGRHSVYNEKDAQWELYGLHKFHALLMEYVLPEYNHGPFVLIHSDFRSSNIMVDEDLNIVSIINWEWSRTVPAQLFVPPEWLTGYEVNGLLPVYNKLLYIRVLFNFKDIVRDQERNLITNGKMCCLQSHYRSSGTRLTKMHPSSLLMHSYGCMYSETSTGIALTAAIMTLISKATEYQLEIVTKKLDDLAIYEKLESLGIEKDQSKEQPKTVQIWTDLLKIIATGGNEAKRGNYLVAE
ncbi:hypothetical protein GP486_004689 [Trichoglossum hirsutum]|uniref:Aminoglycoside phosphotransferase domain-containing protein n=1 Tax=Trichoglossum hirsutum TaxID=265104 RepID=A0A9P8RNN0_9PEZI|nr:hypothetical protein GP486_004689 [Trichoglossum hirsutum]